MSDGGFLSRWSRRKRGAAAEPPEEPAPAAPAAAPAPATGIATGIAAATEPAGPPAEPAPHDATPAPQAVTDGPPRPAPAACPIPGVPDVDLSALPRVEELLPGADISGFLRPGVPAALREAALRRMWSVDPAIRDFIGCVDYQWDFNTPGGLPFGFANELTGDVTKLLAQAIGELTRPDAEADGPVGSAGADGPDAPAGGAAAPEGIATTEAGVAAPQPDSPAEGPAALPASAEDAPASGAGAGAPAPPSSPATGPFGPTAAWATVQPDPEAEPPRRRHGGALPR